MWVTGSKGNGGGPRIPVKRCNLTALTHRSRALPHFSHVEFEVLVIREMVANAIRGVITALVRRETDMVQSIVGCRTRAGARGAK